MRKDNVIPIVSFCLLLLAMAYMWAISGQPRMADGSLSGEEMSLVEKLLVLSVPISVFSAMLIGMRRAYRAGSKSWFFLCLFVWPATFLYTLVVNRSDEL